MKNFLGFGKVLHSFGLNLPKFAALIGSSSLILHSFGKVLHWFFTHSSLPEVELDSTVF